MREEPTTKPIPDPTVATNDAVERAMKSERDYVEGIRAVLIERIQSITERLSRDESSNIRQFAGFPQEYARKVEMDDLRKQIEQIRNDHVQRRELEDVKKSLQTVATSLAVGPAELRQIVRNDDRSAGRREGVGLTANVLVVSITIIIAVIGMVASVVIAVHK